MPYSPSSIPDPDSEKVLAKAATAMGAGDLELHHIPNGLSNGMLMALANIIGNKGLNFERYYAVHAVQEEQAKTDLIKAIGK